jgi:hypothetical protein
LWIAAAGTPENKCASPSSLWIERGSIADAASHRLRRQAGLGRLTPIEFKAIMTAPVSQAA